MQAMRIHKLYWLAALLAALAAAAIFYIRSGPEGLTSDADKLAKVYSLYEGYRQDFPLAPQIAVPEAKRLLTQGKAVFVDVRPPAERAVSIIPGAISEPEFRKDPARYKGKTAIAYCTISYRSGVLSQKLCKRDVNLKNLRGGLLAWALHHGPLVDEKGRPTKRIHVYGRRWDYPPKGYESVY